MRSACGVCGAEIPDEERVKLLALAIGREAGIRMRDGERVGSVSFASYHEECLLVVADHVLAAARPCTPIRTSKSKRAKRDRWLGTVDCRAREIQLNPRPGSGWLALRAAREREGGIYTLGLPQRVRGPLARGTRIATIVELAAWSDADLLCIPGIGPKALAEIRAALESVPRLTRSATPPRLRLVRSGCDATHEQEAS